MACLILKRIAGYLSISAIRRMARARRAVRVLAVLRYDAFEAEPEPGYGCLTVPPAHAARPR
jgi:hypothetical protein